MIPMALSMAHDIDASTGTSTHSRTYIIPSYNHLNMTNTMVSLIAPLTSCGWKLAIAMKVPKTNMPSNTTYKPYVPIKLCAPETIMSVYMPYMNPLQSIM